MEHLNVGSVLILGLAIFGGTLGASLFQRLRIPQVVGYIVIGMLFGASGFNFITPADIEQLQPASLFALSVIGFLVGGELKRETFQTYGKQFMAIVLGEGLGAFVFAGVAVAAIVYYVSGSVTTAAVSGLVFGAIASATDPASTLDVLWEYRSRGVLTTTLIAVVALDDALALTLYGLCTSTAQVISGQDVAILSELLNILLVLGGACLLGLIAGVGLNVLLRYMHQPEKSLTVVVGALLIVLGISAALDMDVILAAMTLGLVLTNLAPLRSKELFTSIRSFSAPIYVLFFVLVGARLSIGAMPPWLWGVAVAYIIFRGAGKMCGAYVGARITNAPIAVRRYAGLGLFPQAGIAVGLSIMAAHRLGAVPVAEGLTLGDAIVFSVTATTFMIQLIGPQLVKLAARLADETGRDVTEEDVVAALKVQEVMDPNVHPVNEFEPLTHVFDQFARQEYLVLPVVNRDQEVIGLISLESLKEVFANQDTWEWLVARDVIAPLPETALSSQTLDQAMHVMRDTGIDQLMVLSADGSNKLAGALDARRVRKIIKEEVLKRQSASA